MSLTLAPNNVGMSQAALLKDWLQELELVAVGVIGAVAVPVVGATAVTVGLGVLGGWPGLGSDLSQGHQIWVPRSSAIFARAGTSLCTLTNAPPLPEEG